GDDAVDREQRQHAEQHAEEPEKAARRACLGPAHPLVEAQGAHLLAQGQAAVGRGGCGGGGAGGWIVVGTRIVHEVTSWRFACRFAPAAVPRACFESWAVSGHAWPRWRAASWPCRYTPLLRPSLRRSGRAAARDTPGACRGRCG